MPTTVFNKSHKELASTPGTLDIEEILVSFEIVVVGIVRLTGTAWIGSFIIFLLFENWVGLFFADQLLKT
jgi:hypothetical protein